MNHLETYSKPSGAPAQSGGSAQLPEQSDGVAKLTGRPVLEVVVEIPACGQYRKYIEH